MQRLPPTQTKILIALAGHKFLTTSQMIRLGVATKRSNLSPHLSKLKGGTKPYIVGLEFGFHPKQGRLEHFYYLKPKAKRALIDELKMFEEDILLPIGTSSLFSNDYFHRKFTIDCQIAVNEAAEREGCEVVFFERYFDKIGSNRKGGTSRAKTRIDSKGKRYLIADGIFMLDTPLDKELYCLEVCNGKNTKRIHKQLEQYVHAMAAGSPSIKYDHKTKDGLRHKGSRVLSIFEHESIMLKVIERLENDILFDNMRKVFLFQSLDGVNEGAFGGWRGINNYFNEIY